MLKINAKLGGTNFGFDVLLRDSYIKPRTMIMGADVTHPGAGSTNVPSFAAVTASYDEDFFRYHMNWRVQPPREEIIADLKEMTKEHLLYYYNHSEKEKPNQKRPQYIVFYRDGVSDTQFAEVKRKELAAIQEACKEVAKQYKWEEDFKPIITFLVVQKRNHARFFPVCPNNKTPAGVDPKQGNVKSGFVVDTIITHPWQIDFFLVSQNAGKGTACPARYRLLFDGGIKINELEIKRMTFYLCFLYARCNQSVSYPAPTYYAHLAAARVKLYCNNKFDDIDTSAGRDKEEIYRDWKAATDRVNDETVKNMKTFIDNNPMYYV
ncbi:protein argonaute-2-like [Cloeon dipterum]|uniref:protein argonaute-2-like n=1 Tax=Cloeon dipterum TaxID=197152 RepID=UPI0032204FD4